MARHSPYPIELSAQERAELEVRSRAYTLPYRDVIRAKVVLLAAQGLQNKQIAQRLSVPRPKVSKWRKRFYEQRLEGLKDHPRAGRPRAFPP